MSYERQRRLAPQKKYLSYEKMKLETDDYRENLFQIT